MQICLAEHDCPRRAQRLYDGCILSRAKTAKCRGPRSRRIFARADAVLDGNRQTEQRTRRSAGAARPVALARRFEHSVRLERYECIERPSRRAARKQRASILFRGEIAARDTRHRLDGAETDELSHARGGR